MIFLYQIGNLICLNLNNYTLQNLSILILIIIYLCPFARIHNKLYTICALLNNTIHEQIYMTYEPIYTIQYCVLNFYALTHQG